MDPVIDDMTKVKEDAADLAFEHATAVAASSNLSIGSDTFMYILAELQENYDHATDHMLYFLHAGLQTVKTAFDTGLIKLQIPVNDRYTGPDVASAIMQLAQVFTAGLIHTIASDDHLWMTNDEMLVLSEKVRAVQFDIQLPPSKMPIQEGQDDDTV